MHVHRITFVRRRLFLPCEVRTHQPNQVEGTEEHRPFHRHNLCGEN